MRQINFLIIFVMLLALVLFSLQNTEPAVIRVVEGVQVQAPLCIELILAMGAGAVLAWIFSVWTRMQRLIEARKDIREIQDRDVRIQELQDDIERYKVEINEQRSLPPAESRGDGETADAYAS